VTAVPECIVKGYDARGVTDAYANLTNGICLFCYVAAVLSAYGYSFITDEQGGLDELYPPARAVLLGAAGGFLAVGAVLHVVFYRWRPEQFQNRAFCMGLTFFAGMLVLTFGLPFLLSRTTGLSSETLEKMVAALWVPYCFAWFFGTVGYRHSSTERSLCNRMAHLMQSGDFMRAIAIGQAQPPHKRDLAVNYNLAVAYANMGLRDKARESLALVEQARELPKNVTRATFEQSVKELRKVIEGAAQTEPARPMQKEHGHG